MSYQISNGDFIILAILVLYLGYFITRKISILERYNIPPAVSGGIICSIVVAYLHTQHQLYIEFDMRIRDLLLLVFFSTIGLSAKFSMLMEGGKALVILAVLAGAFLVVQDVTGILIAKSFGANPAYGLFAGSVSLAGGHGTAIAWGDTAVQAGLVAAKEVGIMFATLGLIVGGLIGGPIAQWLVTRYDLSVNSSMGTEPVVKEKVNNTDPFAIKDRFNAILALAICVEAGDSVNHFLFSAGVTLPGFLTAMLVGIIFTNTSMLFNFKLNKDVVAIASEASLQLFLAMSLMSMQLWTLANALGPMMITLIIQMIVITLFVVFIVFRIMGKDYDAAVIAAGFAGLGMGATPVAIANMSAVTHKFGVSPKAFLIVPLIGAFFIDIMNAVVIKFFAASPLIQGL